MAGSDRDLEIQEQYEEVERELLDRWPETRIDPSLDHVQALVDLLGQPQRAYPVIQVAGTNGKTSTSRMIETLLRELNLRTGRFTSPHLESMTDGSAWTPSRSPRSASSRSTRTSGRTSRWWTPRSNIRRRSTATSPAWRSRLSRTPRSMSRCSKWGWVARGTTRRSLMPPSLS